MRVGFPALVAITTLVLLTVPIAAVASATGGDWLSWSTSRKEIDAAGAFVAGIRDYDAMLTAIAGARGDLRVPPAFGFACVPQQVNTGDLVTGFQGYLRRHPESTKRLAVLLFHMYTVEMWPCGQ